MTWKFLIIGYLINLCSSSTASQLHTINVCSKWNNTEQIIYKYANMTAFNSSFGLNLNNSGLDINRQTNAIAVLDDINHRVIIFNQSNLTTIIAILSNVSNSTVSYTTPSAIAYDNSSAIYIFDRYEQQIVKINNPIEYGKTPASVISWNTSIIHPRLNFTSFGLCIDNTDGSILISDSYYHRIIRSYPSYRLNTTTYIGNGAGNATDQLNTPTSIVIDNTQRLYVNDAGNNRIQMFEYGAKNGTTLMNISDCVSLSLYGSEILVIANKTTVLLLHLMDHNKITCAIGCNNTSQFTNIHNALIDNNGSLIITDANQVKSYQFYEECPVPKTFMPYKNCSSGRFGSDCSFSNSICNLTRPCFNNGTCIENATNENGFNCSCTSDYTGFDCRTDQRPCQPHFCFGHGTPNNNITNCECKCFAGYTGQYCELKINFCANVTCQNNGVCGQKFLGYTCNCLPGYSGLLCEKADTSTVVHGYVTKSFGYVAITMLAILISFFIFMDVLKYVFGIDPVQANRDALRKRNAKNIKKKNNNQRPSVGYRFKYYN